MTAEEFLENSNIFEKENSFYFNDVQNIMQEYTKLKCKELLLLVAEKARITEDNDGQHEEYYLDLGGYLKVDKDSILNAVDLEKFCY